ncbi:MAG: hypothetical protein Q8910_02485 [Bacteroidota bacterium]|nr:hypothetical protein [Bacteroidota bacterium]
MTTANAIAFLLIFESCILGFLGFLTFFGYPAWMKIALSKIKGKQYVVKLTRDNVLIFEGAKEVEGVYKTPNGIYELEPEDSFSFNGSTGALWYAPYNRAVLPRVMPLLKDLKKFGIDHYGQLMYYWNTPIEKIKADLGEAAAEQALVIKGYEGRILQDLEVVRIPDLKNFLESRSPSAENGVIERYVNIERRKLGNPLKNSNVILMLVMAALLGLAFGYIMAGGSGGESTAVQSVSNAAGSLSQIR